MQAVAAENLRDCETDPIGVKGPRGCGLLTMCQVRHIAKASIHVAIWTQSSRASGGHRGEEKTMMHRLDFLVLAAALSVLPAIAATAQMQPGRAHQASLEQVLVESADSPAEHRALANYYRERAEQMRSMAEHHEVMAKTYHGKIPQRRKMEKHCSELVALYGKMEAEYLALAKDHDEAAKQ